MTPIEIAKKIQLLQRSIAEYKIEIEKLKNDNSQLQMLQARMQHEKDNFIAIHAYREKNLSSLSQKGRYVNAVLGYTVKFQTFLSGKPYKSALDEIQRALDRIKKQIATNQRSITQLNRKLLQCNNMIGLLRLELNRLTP